MSETVVISIPKQLHEELKVERDRLTTEFNLKFTVPSTIIYLVQTHPSIREEAARRTSVIADNFGLLYGPSKRKRSSLPEKEG